MCYFCALWNESILLFPEIRLSRTLMGILQTGWLACTLLLYGSVCSCFHNQRLTNLISLQNMEDDGQMCHFTSWIVSFQNQFKVFNFHTVPNTHLLSNNILWQEITTLSFLCADLDHVVTQIWSRPHNPLNQLNWWTRKLQHETGTFIIAFV